MLSSQRCEWNAIDGLPSGVSTSRRNTRRRNAPSDYPPGATNCSRRSSDSSWTATLMSSLAITLTVFAHNEDVIPRYRRFMKPGQERRGSWKAIFRRVSIMHLDAPLKNASAGTDQREGV